MVKNKGFNWCRVIFALIIMVIAFHNSYSLYISRKLLAS